MGRSLQLLNADCQAEFERHIEARRSRGFGIQLHAGKVVNRVAAVTDEIEDFVESPLAARDVERDTGVQAEMDEPDNISQVKTAKRFIVRNVQKDRVVVSLRQLSGHGYLSFLPCV